MQHARPARPPRCPHNPMILASGHPRFMRRGPRPADCQIISSSHIAHAKTSSSHLSAASRAGVPNFCATDRLDPRVVRAVAHHTQLVASALAGERTGGSYRGRLLVSVGQLQRSSCQTPPTGAQLAGPFISAWFGRHLHSHQGSQSESLMSCPQPNARPNKKALILDQGLFRFLVPLVGFELTTYRLQGGCSTN
jgi:hypothetical protein